jgi:hypothetical protein
MSMLNTTNLYHPDKVLDPLYEINSHEHIFTRFCKTILGVHSKAVNRAVRAESSTQSPNMISDLTPGCQKVIILTTHARTNTKYD